MDLIFLKGTGDLDTASQVMEKCLDLSGAENRTVSTANALGNLGLLYENRGELDQAEELYHKALEIDEELGCKEGIASDYCNLGCLYKKIGKLTQAGDMYKKSLVLFRELQSPNAERVEELLKELREVKDQDDE